MRYGLRKSLSVPDEHVPEDGEVAVVAVFNYSGEDFTSVRLQTQSPQVCRCQVTVKYLLPPPRGTAGLGLSCCSSP